MRSDLADELPVISHTNSLLLIAVDYTIQQGTQSHAGERDYVVAQICAGLREHVKAGAR